MHDDVIYRRGSIASEELRNVATDLIAIWRKGFACVCHVTRTLTGEHDISYNLC